MPENMFYLYDRKEKAIREKGFFLKDALARMWRIENRCGSLGENANW